MAGHPAALQLERCAQLVHATPLRRRYLLRSTTRLDWAQVARHLEGHLPGRGLDWRLNPAAHSIVISGRADGSSAPLEQGLPILLAALARGGARPPAAEVVRIALARAKPTPRVRRAGGPWRWLLVPVNLASLALSLSLLALAALIALLGLLGLLLPLAPGAPLLVLAGLAVELALLLRLPFLAQPAA